MRRNSSQGGDIPHEERRWAVVDTGAGGRPGGDCGGPRGTQSSQTNGRCGRRGQGRTQNPRTTLPWPRKTAAFSSCLYTFQVTVLKGQTPVCWQSLFTNSTKILIFGRRKGLTKCVLPATGISGHQGTERTTGRLLRSASWLEGASPRQQPQA